MQGLPAGERYHECGLMKTRAVFVILKAMMNHRFLCQPESVHPIVILKA